MDMVRTAVNVSGDAVVTLVIANSEDKLALATYSDADAGIVDTDESIHLDPAIEEEMADVLRETHDRQ
jgi:Na+/H+-dicarboxylate symporter